MSNLISMQVALGLAGTALMAGALGVVLLVAFLFMSRGGGRPKAAPPLTPGLSQVSAAEPAPPTAPVPPSKRSGPGCGILLGCGCLALIVLLLLGAGGGYLAYQRGLITMNSILNLIGLGPGDIEVDNFRDDSVYVAITQLDPPANETPLTFSLELAPYEIRQQRVSTLGRYRVDFGTASGGADLGTCTLTLKSGDLYQFVPMPERIAINRANRPSDSGPDFVVESSLLCR